MSCNDVRKKTSSVVVGRVVPNCYYLHYLTGVVLRKQSRLDADSSYIPPSDGFLR